MSKPSTTAGSFKTPYRRAHGLGSAHAGVGGFIQERVVELVTNKRLQIHEKKSQSSPGTLILSLIDGGKLWGKFKPTDLPSD